MDLREAIRTVIREVAEEELRRIVREVILEELVAEDPRRTAAKKAAVTRAENKKNGNLVGHVPKGKTTAKVPERARKLGVFPGQQYKGKSHSKKIGHRTIEVVRLDDRYIYPKILGSAGKNAKAKRISYEHLQKNYDRIF